MRSLGVFDGAPALAEGAARYVAALARAAIAERGQFSIALAGGSTPKATYEALARPPLRESVDWSRVLVFFGDERAVAMDHADSNYRMAREALLSRVPLPESNVHRLEADGGDLDAAARDYERVLATIAGRLDLALLGIGEDGHTASLFPDVADSCLGPALVRAVRSASPIAKGVARLTLTLPALDAARAVAFLASGAGKAAVVARARAGDPALPAARVAAASVAWLLDRPAAAGV